MLTKLNELSMSWPKQRQQQQKQQPVSSKQQRAVGRCLVQSKWQWGVAGNSKALAATALLQTAIRKLG